MKLKPKFKNNPRGACGIYALANIFNDKELVEKYPASKSGYMLSEYIAIVSEKYSPITLAPLYVFPTPRRLSAKGFFEEIATSIANAYDKLFIACLVEIQTGEIHQAGHAIAMFVELKGLDVYVVDSASGAESAKMSIDFFFERYQIASLSIIADAENKAVAAVNFVDLKHLIH